MELEGHEACVSIQYNFDKTGETLRMFMRFFKIFTKAMLSKDSGGEILMSYSQKVETKKLGCVTGVYGVMKWHTHIANIQKPEEFEFLLTEYEINLPSPKKNSKCYICHSPGNKNLTETKNPIINLCCPDRDPLRYRQ